MRQRIEADLRRLLLRPHNVRRSKERRGRIRKMQELTTDHVHFFLLTVLQIEPLSRPASVRRLERGALPCSHGHKYPAQQAQYQVQLGPIEPIANAIWPAFWAQVTLRMQSPPGPF